MTPPLHSVALARPRSYVILLNTNLYYCLRFLCQHGHKRWPIIHMYNYICTHTHTHTVVGTDYCLRPCENFYSNVCRATSPMRWIVNGVPIEQINSPSIILSPRRYDDTGHWEQNLTALNICVLVNISCFEGEQELLSYTIRLCKQMICMYIP